MRRFALALACLAAVAAVPAAAQAERSAEAWSEAGATRFVTPAAAAAERAAIAAYGPFRVLDEATAALVGVTDRGSPAAFEAMLREHPGIATLRMVECPGTYDDGANLALGRRIRAAGLATEVPAGGSVRSGAVELFLAGSTRRIDDEAQFAVHAWLDTEGRQPGDYLADSPENARYLAYYREMGMTGDAAEAFYAMTNSVPFDEARWLSGSEMRGWLGDGAAPRLAYLDLSALLN